MIIRLLPIIFFLFIHCIASSQEITNHNSISTIIEDIIEGVEDDDQKTELAEDLE